MDETQTLKLAKKLGCTQAEAAKLVEVLAEHLLADGLYEELGGQAK